MNEPRFGTVCASCRHQAALPTDNFCEECGQDLRVPHAQKKRVVPAVWIGVNEPWPLRPAPLPAPRTEYFESLDGPLKRPPPPAITTCACCADELMNGRCRRCDAGKCNGPGRCRQGEEKGTPFWVFPALVAAVIFCAWMLGHR